MKLLNIRDRVRRLLEDHPHVKDSDNQLMIRLWGEELDENGNSWDSFPLLFRANILTTPEAITRCRRKLQEKNKSLRGVNYLKRHQEQEVVKDELREPVWTDTCEEMGYEKKVYVEDLKPSEDWRQPTKKEIGELEDLDTNQQSLDL